jgi:hypothetical protein
MISESARARLARWLQITSRGSVLRGGGSVSPAAGNTSVVDGAKSSATGALRRAGSGMAKFIERLS